MMSKSLQWLILMSQFLMILALEITNPFLSLLIASQHEMTLQNAMFYSMISLVLPMIAQIIMSPVWGIIADRYGYKPMLMRAAWALVATQLGMVYMHSLVGILIIRVLQGAFAGFIVSMQAYLLSLCEWNNKSWHLMRLQSAKAIATTLAGFVGGLILCVTNYQELYGIAAVICLITTLVMHCYLPYSEKNVDRDVEQKTNNGLSSIHLSFLCILITLTQVVKFLPDPGLSLYVKDFISSNLIFIGVVYSLPALGMIIGSGWCGRQFDRCRGDLLLIRRYLVYYSLLGLVLMLCQAFTYNFYVFASLRILWGFILAALLPALFALISDRYSLPGYALGLANSFAKLGNLIGLLLGGILIQWLPYPMLFVIISSLYGLFVLIVLGYHWLFFNQISQISNTYSDVIS